MKPQLSVAVLCAVVHDVACTGFPWPHWPWPHHNATSTTTTPPPAPSREFERGVSAALGFDDVQVCFEKSPATIENLYEAGSLYQKGGWENKIKALEKFAAATKDIVSVLEACSSAMTSGERYAKLVQNLKDPRYYTMWNAITLGLNLAEDRKMLAAFARALEQKQYYEAGLKVMGTVLDVLERPNIPRDGKPAAQFIQGLVAGFGGSVDLPCLSDAKVELEVIISGVLHVESVVGIVSGLESIFHALEGIVPLVKACKADVPKIKELLHQVADFRHPAELAKELGHNILSNGGWCEVLF